MTTKWISDPIARIRRCNRIWHESIYSTAAWKQQQFHRLLAHTLCTHVFVALNHKWSKCLQYSSRIATNCIPIWRRTCADWCIAWFWSKTLDSLLRPFCEQVFPVCLFLTCMVMYVGVYIDSEVDGLVRLWRRLSFNQKRMRIMICLNNGNFELDFAHCICVWTVDCGCIDTRVVIPPICILCSIWRIHLYTKHCCHT